MEAWIGTILPVAFDYAPEGWVMAHGQVLNLNQYQAAFAVMGVAYGGDGRQTFSLPELRARAPVGYDTRKAAFYGLGKTAGVETVTLNPTNLPAHTHAARFEPRKAQAVVNIPAQTGSLKVTPKMEVTSAVGAHQVAEAGDMLGASSNAIAKNYVSTSTNPVSLKGLSAAVTGTAATPAMTATLNDMVVGGSVMVEPAGATTPTPIDVRMPYLAINFIVCLYGIFPSRP